MNNREIFEVAEIEVIAFDAEDILTTSNLEDPFAGEEDDVMGALNFVLSHRS